MKAAEPAKLSSQSEWDKEMGYECHCCGSIKTEYIQHYVLRRTLAVAPMYLCGNCNSISVDFDIVKKHYPHSKSSDAIAFHKSIRERNEKWAIALLQQVRKVEGPGYQLTCVIDIGCAIGTLLGVAAHQGIKAVGYEIDPLALAEARTDARIEIHDELFTRYSPPEQGALVCCIAVLEHLQHPLGLLRDIAAYCHATGSQGFVFVPLLPENWRSYLNESVMAKGNPFFDNEEHVTHFTADSFTCAWRDAFGVTPKPLSVGGWAGYYYSGQGG